MDTEIPQRWELGARTSGGRAVRCQLVGSGVEGSCHRTPLELVRPPGGQAATKGPPGAFLRLTLGAE